MTECKAGFGGFYVFHEISRFVKNAKFSRKCTEYKVIFQFFHDFQLNDGHE